MNHDHAEETSDFFNSLLGGRYYGPYQIIPKQERRSGLTIDGNPTVELDFRHMHPTLLYLEHGVPLAGDPYDVNGFDRNSIVKPAWNILINARDGRKARWAIAELFDPPPKQEPSLKGRPSRRPHRPSREAFTQAGRLIEILKFKHSAIAGSICTGAGLRLQRIDAEIMQDIQKRCMRASLPALCLHDAIIVPESDAEIGLEIMFSSARAISSFNAEITMT